MPPLPKRKTPKSKQGKRRSHLRTQVPHIVECPQCGNPRISHRACEGCRTYRGRTVFEDNEPEMNF